MDGKIDPKRPVDEQSSKIEKSDTMGSGSSLLYKIKKTFPFSTLFKIMKLIQIGPV